MATVRKLDSSFDAYISDVSKDESNSVETGTLTKNERLVYNELSSSQVPLKAYNLLAALGCKGIRAPMTIYRALEGLAEKGLVRKISSLNAFVAVSPSSSSHVIAYVTCRQCGKTDEVALVQNLASEIADKTTIVPTDVFVEVFGDCPQNCKVKQ